jgi:hypothetical protein
MKEPYIEGPAIHDDPESCVDVREDAGEALTGARAGWAIEPEMAGNRGADALAISGRQHHRRRFREPPTGPAGSKNLCMRGISMRENREIPRSPASGDGWAGRAGKAEAVIPQCTIVGSQTVP